MLHDESQQPQTTLLKGRLMNLETLWHAFVWNPLFETEQKHSQE